MIKRFIFCAGCYALILFLGFFRSPPLYGKLDFFTIDSTGWWPELRPMLAKVLATDHSKPVLTDPITSTILQSIFNRETVYFRTVYGYYTVLSIEAVEEMNKPFRERLPFGAMSLLATQHGQEGFEQQINEQLNLLAELGTNRPYECIINLHGFTPTWVPVETGHWNPNFAVTPIFYKYKGARRKDIIPLLKQDSLQNCWVYF